MVLIFLKVQIKIVQKILLKHVSFTMFTPFLEITANN